MTDATRNYRRQLARDTDGRVQRSDPACFASSLALQGVSVSLLRGGILYFGDVETFLRLRNTMPELTRFTVRAPLP